MRKDMRTQLPSLDSPLEMGTNDAVEKSRRVVLSARFVGGSRRIRKLSWRSGPDVLDLYQKRSGAPALSTSTKCVPPDRF
jgi:hypothetical protein